MSVSQNQAPSSFALSNHPFSVNSSMSTAINDTLSILQQAPLKRAALRLIPLMPAALGIWVYLWDVLK